MFCLKQRLWSDFSHCQIFFPLTFSWSISYVSPGWGKIASLCISNFVFSANMLTALPFLFRLLFYSLALLHFPNTSTFQVRKQSSDRNEGFGFHRMQAFILWGSSLIAIHGKSSRVEMQEKGAKGMTACKVDFFFFLLLSLPWSCV